MHPATVSCRLIEVITSAQMVRYESTKRLSQRTRWTNTHHSYDICTEIAPERSPSPTSQRPCHCLPCYFEYLCELTAACVSLRHNVAPTNCGISTGRLRPHPRSLIHYVTVSSPWRRLQHATHAVHQHHRNSTRQYYRRR